MRLRESYPTGWIRQNKIKTSSGLPFEFHNHLFMVDPMDDMSRLQVWLKPPQIGATEGQIVKSFFCAKKGNGDGTSAGWRIIYTLPTATDVNDMAGGKINPIVAQNPVLQQMVKDHDTIEQKRVGNKTIYYRGTFTTKSAMMVSSECNIHDEVDASDPQVIDQYETRLMSNDIENQRRWYFSHPSLSGMGVDKYWQISDKKEWFIVCPTCKGEQQLQWPDNVDIEGQRYICSLCKTTLPDEARRVGVWKATAEGEFSGYHISQLMCVWIPASKIVHDWFNKDKEYFFNKVLGLPYVGSENKIEASVVLNNATSVPNMQQPRVIIGVDTGLPIHITLANKDGAFFYKTCKPPTMREDGTTSDPYDEIEKLLLHFDRSIVVADQGGDLIGIRRLQAKYPGRVFLCYYRKDKKGKEMIKWGKDKEFGTVVVDRNRMISLIVEQLREVGYINLCGKREEWETFASHFGNIYREKVTVKETIGKDAHTLYGNEYVWKRIGPDHFVHTLVYALTGLDRFKEDLATVVKKSDGFMKGVETASDVHGNVSARRVLKKQGVSSGMTKVIFND